MPLGLFYSIADGTQDSGVATELHRASELGSGGWAPGGGGGVGSDSGAAPGGGPLHTVVLLPPTPWLGVSRRPAPTSPA